MPAEGVGVLFETGGAFHGVDPVDAGEVHVVVVEVEECILVVDIFWADKWVVCGYC